MSKIEVELQEVYGTDKSVAESAWTSSYNKQVKEQRPEEDVERIVNMLADLKHSVPFESVIFRFWLRLPIAIDRQLMTHRIASHSGMSGRYRTMPDDFLGMPEDIIQILEKANIIPHEYYDYCTQANDYYKRVCGYLKYEEEQKTITNKELKRAREFMRGVLPQHNMTERVTIMNLRSWANFMKLRDKPDAQPEIQFIAQQMLEQVKASGVCPIALDALERNGWVI